MTSLLLALVTLFIGSANMDAPKPQARPEVVSDEYTKRFEFACSYAEFLYGVKCGDLAPPYVVISQVVGWEYYGFYYTGDHFIFVNPYLSKDMTLRVVLHETMHYVLHWTKAPVGRCESEEQARRVDALWSNEPYDDSWRAQYKCLPGSIQKPSK